MNKNNKWKYYEKKGVSFFILYMGVFRLGLVGGFSCLLFYYLYFGIQFSFKSFDPYQFAWDYLIWWPIAILIGIVSAYFMWVNNVDD